MKSYQETKDLITALTFALFLNHNKGEARQRELIYALREQYDEVNEEMRKTKNKSI